MKVDIANLPTQEVPIAQIEFDEENPRIQFLNDNLRAQGKKTISQEEIRFAQAAKTKSSYDKLLTSIETRGLIDPIWLYKRGDKYVTIEGNTRKMVFEDLVEKYPGDSRWLTIKAKVLPEGVSDDDIAFLRLEAHLGGKRPWDAYERARYLYELSLKGYTKNRLATEARTNSSEVEKDLKAYELMREEFLPHFGRVTENPTSKYSFFVELVKNKEMRKLIQTSEISVEDFCSWVAEDKIPMAINVRNLPHIYDDAEAIKIFKDKEYESAMLYLSTIKPEVASQLFRDIEKVIYRLKNLRNFEITEIREEKVKRDTVLELIKQANDILDM